jgi:hypothetical protein
MIISIKSGGQPEKAGYVPGYCCVISKDHPLIVGPFGPCYVLTGYDSKTGYKFVTHINDCTDCKSIPSIFEALKKLSVKINDLSLKLLGGWENKAEIKFWGDKLWGYQIIDQLKELKVYKQTDTKRLHEKKFLPIGQNPDYNNYDKHYFNGGIMRNGNFNIFKGPFKKLGKIKDKLSEKYEKDDTKIKKEIIKKVCEMMKNGKIDLKKKSVNLIVDGKTVKILTKKIKPIPVREIHVKPLDKPLKIFIMKNENILVEVS